MTTLAFEWDDKQVLKHFQRFGREGAEAARRGVSKALQTFEDHFIKRRMKKQSSDSLGTRTGQFRRYLTRKVKGSRFSNIEGRIYFAMPRKLRGMPFIHEHGGTIRSKGKLLTVPLKAAMTPSGVPKKRKARDWKDTFIQTVKGPSGKPQAIIFLNRGVGKSGRALKPVPLYVLARQVTIPPRLNFQRTFKESRQLMLTAMVKEWAKFAAAFAKRGGS